MIYRLRVNLRIWVDITEDCYLVNINEPVAQTVLSVLDLRHLSCAGIILRHLSCDVRHLSCAGIIMNGVAKMARYVGKTCHGDVQLLFCLLQCVAVCYE